MRSWRGWRAHSRFLSKGRRVFGDLGYLGKVTMEEEWEENVETSEQAGSCYNRLGEPR